MSILSELFTGGASEVVDSVGTAIDKVVTSDEERGQLKNKLQSIVSGVTLRQLDSADKLEAEMTKRLQIDTTSDSWLSKNVRPLIALGLVAATILFAFVAPFYAEGAALSGSFELLKLGSAAAIGFYFTSRGMEKVQKIKTGGS